MQLCYGFAYSANNNVITNYFEDVLHFSGPQFGYMTAIREFGGLSLILLMALLYRVSIQWLTAGAMFLLGLGFGLFGVATGFVSVIPWILLSSFGMHTILQTQFSLGMSLTTQERSGHVLGRLGAFIQAGTFAALIVVFLIFHFDLLSYELTFMIIGIVAVIGAIAIFRFPHLHDGEERKVAPKREPFVWRKDYRYYYWLNLLGRRAPADLLLVRSLGAGQSVQAEGRGYLAPPADGHVRRHVLVVVRGAADRPPGRTPGLAGHQHRLRGRAGRLRAGERRVPGLRLLRPLLLHLHVLDHRGLDLSAQDRGARGGRPQPGDGCHHPARDGRRGAGGWRGSS